MQLVGSRFGDDVDYAAGVQSISRGQTAGFDTEFLQRVGERERHVHVGEIGDVVASVEQVVGAIALAAGHRHGGGTGVVLAADHVGVRRGGGGSGDHDEIGHLTAVQGQLAD